MLYTIFFGLAFDYIDKSNITDVIYGVSIAEILAIGYVLFHFTTRKVTVYRFQLPIVLKVLLFSFMLFSLPAKGHFLFSDVFEILRTLLYLMLLLAITSLDRDTFENLAAATLLGFVVSFLANLATQIVDPTNIQFAGFYQVQARNQTGGGIVALAAVTLTMFLLGRQPALKKFWLLMFIMLGSMLLFVFSYGAWVGFLFLLPAFVYGVFNTYGIGGAVKFLILFLIGIFIYLEDIQIALQAIFDLVEIKGKTREGNTLSEQNLARLGNMYASLMMLSEHPFVGVASSAWGDHNLALSAELGKYFHPNDNPHSGAFLVFATSGVFGTLIYILSELQAFTLMRYSPLLAIASLGVFMQQFLLIQYVSSIIFMFAVCAMVMMINKR